MVSHESVILLVIFTENSTVFGHSCTEERAAPELYK